MKKLLLALLALAFALPVNAQWGGVYNSRPVNTSGSTSITTLGTVTTGTWNADPVGTAYGGTGQSTTATSGRYLKGDGSLWGTSSGSASGTGACAGNSWVSTLNSDAAPTCTTPSATSLSNGVTGSGATVLTNSPTITSATLVTPALGTPASGVGTNITGVNAATLGGSTFATAPLITSAVTSGGFLQTTGAGTAATWMAMSNTAANSLIGIEGAAGGAICTGTTAYALVICKFSNNPVQVAVNNAIVANFTAASTALTGTITVSAIASASGNELLCYNTSGGVITYAASVLGCVPSGNQFKDVTGIIDPPSALASVMKMNPGYGTFKDAEKFGSGEHVWLFADEVCDVDERLCKRDSQGRPENYDKYGTVAYLVAAMKAQQAQIDHLKSELARIRGFIPVAQDPKVAFDLTRTVH